MENDNPLKKGLGVGSATAICVGGCLDRGFIWRHRDWRKYQIPS